MNTVIPPVLLKLSKYILWIVALFYAYGALVHILNILGLTGFEWLKAPLKWQVLDVVYLVLDVVVAIGFFLSLDGGVYCFLCGSGQPDHPLYGVQILDH